MKITFCLFIHIIIFCLFFCQASFATESSLYQLCKSSFEKGEFLEAQKQAELFIKSYPNSRWLEEIQFISASVEADFNLAESKYLKLIEKNGKWSDKSKLELAQRYLLKGDFDKVIQYCQATLSATPLKVKAHYLLCKTLMAKKLYDEAILELKKLQADPESKMFESDISFKIAECHFQKSEYDKATDIYQSLLEKYPQSRWTYLARQREAICQQKLTEALNALGKFYIQAGAFTDRDNALQLVQFLKERSYQAVLIPPDKNENLFRVKVGNFKDEQEAKKIAQKLRQSNGLPAKIMFQEPKDEKKVE